MSREIPAKWTSIAVYSSAENRFITLPSTNWSEDAIIGDSRIARKTVTVGKKKFLQIKAK